MSKGKLRGIVCVMLSLLLLAGCSGSKEDSGTNNPGSSGSNPTNESSGSNPTNESSGFVGYVGTSGGGSMQVTSARDSVSFRINADLATLDPHMTSGTGNEKIVQYQFYESLFSIDRFNGESEVNPCLAENYEYLDDQKTELKIYLRKGVKFHNGEEMTADDVLFSLERSLDSGFNSVGQGFFKSFEKIDDYTILLHMNTPYSGILRVLATASFMIVSKTYCEENPDLMDRNPCGTGAYVFDQWIPGDRITMTAFPDYWRGEAAIKKGTFIIIPDDSAYLISLENNEVDTGNSIATADVEAVRKNPNLGYDKAASGGGGRSILFNCATGVFSDVRMRQAVIHAVDREEIFLGAYDGEGYIPYGLLGNVLPEVPSEEDWEPLAYDVELAKQLVIDAGYPEGVTITVPTIDSAIYTKPTIILQEQLAKIGINLVIDTMARATWNEKVMANSDFEMTFWAIVTDYDEIDALLYRFHSSRMNGNGNFFNYSNPKLDELLDVGRSTEPGDERNAIYKAALEILRDDAVFYTCQGGSREVAYNLKLQGMKAVTGQQYYLFNLWWAE